MKPEIKLRDKKFITPYGNDFTHAELCFGRIYGLYIRKRIEGKLKLIRLGSLCEGCSQIHFNKKALIKNEFLEKKRD